MELRVRRRGNLSGWILMAVLFIAAMSFIFYILLLRAQHLASMEEQRQNPDADPEAYVQLFDSTVEHVVMHARLPGELPVPHVLVFGISA
jgi:hypothetical protein